MDPVTKWMWRVVQRAFVLAAFLIVVVIALTIAQAI